MERLNGYQECSDKLRECSDKLRELSEIIREMEQEALRNNPRGFLCLPVPKDIMYLVKVDLPIVSFGSKRKVQRGKNAKKR